MPILLATSVHPLPELPKLLDAYHAARKQHGHEPARPEHITLLMPVFVSTDAARVREIMAPSIRHHAELAEQLLSAAQRSSTGSQFEALAKSLDHVRTLDVDRVDQNLGALGDVDHCRARLRQISTDVRPGRVIAWFDFGGRVPHAQVLESMALFGQAILPEWQRGEV